MAFSPPNSLAASPHVDRPFLFQPPKSPASVSTTPSFATATDYFSSSRKRQHPGSGHAYDAHHATITPSWAQFDTPSDRLFESGYGQNSDLVNEKYHLAGGFDTPSLRTTSHFEKLTVPEHEFRRRLRDDDMGNNLQSNSAPLSGPLARERNGIARMPSSPNEIPRATWTGFAVRLVGKVFSFGSNVVRGFYAGDGQGYDMNCALVGSDLLQEGIHRTSTPVPGSWQDGEFLGDFEQDSPDFGLQPPVSRPPNKRRQTDRDTWVMIGTPDLEEGAPPSPKRKISGNSVPRSNLAQRPSASRASSRRSIAPVPRRAHSNITSNGSPAALSMTPTQQGSHSRRASVAPTRSPQRPSTSGSGTAYMSPEAERYAKRQAKHDKAADKAMSNMSKRMEDMIRQAQEALGTKVSVEGDMEVDDEGFVDEDW